MRLNELSSNVSRIKSSIDEDELVKLLKSSARNSYDAIKRQPIFTKVEAKEPFFIVDPSKAKRKSKFIIDSLCPMLPSWQGWTSRLECVRGWTSKQLADSRGTGQLCLLIPFDHTRVHTTGAASFYRSFTKAHKMLEVEKLDNGALSEWLQSLYEVAKLADSTLPAYVEPETAGEFMKLINKLDGQRQAVNKLKADDIAKVDRLHLRRAMNIFKAGNLAETLSKLLDPDDNGFQRHTSLYNLPGNREVWTGGKCIVVTLDEYEALVKREALK